MTGLGRMLLLGALVVGLASPALAVTYQVNAAAACPGSGTNAAPYCAIGSAATVAVAGDVIQVAAGTYREQVTPPTSGAAGLPITYRGAAGAKIYGTNNLSGAGLWTLASGTTYATPYNPPTNPAQVFVDGNRLAASAAGADAVPASAFFYDATADVLYVNLGGDNPGIHDVEAGARSFGFAIEGRSYLIVDGFEVRGHNTNGIRVRSSANVIVRNSRVLRAASFGLVADGTTAPTTTGPVELSNNEVLENGSAGIRLRTNVTQATVRGNRSHHNASHGVLASETTASLFENNQVYENALPGGGFTTGLRLDNSTGNVIQRNLAYGNQDTGFQVSAGSSNNLLVRNISYANQDHGFDIRECDSPRLVSNTAWANANDGISVEGNVTNAYLRNNVSTDNGLLTNGNDLYVRDDSVVGFSSDYDVFHRSSASGNTIEFNAVTYANAAAFAGTGNEVHGSSASPNLVNPNAGDFHPGLGSAIDASDAGASGFAALDFDGLAPIDLTGVPDTGAGVPAFADRGALERRDAPPVARLVLSTKKAKINQPITANGSGSTDDVGIASYRFTWGDGTPDTVQAGPVASHAYAQKGNFKVRLTVTDGAGQTASAQQPVGVAR